MKNGKQPDGYADGQTAEEVTILDQYPNQQVDEDHSFLVNSPITQTSLRFAMGWLRDNPDYRDFTPGTKQVSSRSKSKGIDVPVYEMLKKTGTLKADRPALPASMDLRQWCSPIENQGNLGSCTAQAGVGLVEYFEKRAFGRHLDASRLFLYKVTRNLMHWTGDTGAYLRNTMGGLTFFGVPPEEYWPYNIAEFDKEPSAFCYAFAQSYQTISYYRLDPIGTSPADLLTRIKTNLAAYMPAIFGFTVYNSIDQAARNGKIPFPANGESVAGGHAVMAVGYDDSLEIVNANNGNVRTKGAFLIRNSWGTNWGMSGYGWLPYDYVLKGLAVDWWSLMKHEWVDSGQFKIE